MMFLDVDLIMKFEILPEEAQRELQRKRTIKFAQIDAFYQRYLPPEKRKEKEEYNTEYSRHRRMPFSQVIISRIRHIVN